MPNTGAKIPRRGVTVGAEAWFPSSNIMRLPGSPLVRHLRHQPDGSFEVDPAQDLVAQVDPAELPGGLEVTVVVGVLVRGLQNTPVVGAFGGLKGVLPEPASSPRRPGPPLRTGRRGHPCPPPRPGTPRRRHSGPHPPRPGPGAAALRASPAPRPAPGRRPHDRLQDTRPCGRRSPLRTVVSGTERGFRPIASTSREDP
jgi:hypothetical protein